MKKILLLAGCFFMFSLVDANAQRTTYVGEENVDVSGQMEALVSKKNGDYQVYKYRNGNLAVATVENGAIKTVTIRAPNGTIIPSVMRSEGGGGRAGAKVPYKCFIEWDERGENGKIRHIRIQIKCPKNFAS